MSKLFRTITTKSDAPANNPAAPQENHTRIFIRDMRVDMGIGIYDHEKTAPQPVLVNIVCDVTPPTDWRADDYAQVVCYETIANAVKKIAAAGHINLVETFAEHIADFCMQDPRITAVTIGIEKTSVFDFARGAGIEIRRQRS